MKNNLQKEFKKLLLIDDDPNLILLVKDYLEFRGYNVTSAENGREALNILEKETPAVILLDLNLLDEDGNQVADGFQICREIKRSSQNVPVVVVSAEDESEATEWALHQGADAFIQKPFAVSDLLEVLNRVLGIS